MGFYDPSEKRSAVTELRRLEAFRDNEPKSAMNHAAVARWYSLEGDPKSSLRLLQQALDAHGQITATRGPGTTGSV